MARRDLSRANLSRRSRVLAVATSGSLLTSVLVALTAWGSETPIGAPLFWPWLLTGLQVLALWVAGRGSAGWLLGAAVQPPWIAYAVFTGQIGFIPGCAISALVQTYSYLRSSSTPRLDRVGAPLT